MFLEGVNRTGRQVRQAQARFDREIDAYKAAKRRQEREEWARAGARKKALITQAKAILASEEAAPWILSFAQRIGKTAKQAAKELVFQAECKPERIIAWAGEKQSCKS